MRKDPKAKLFFPLHDNSTLCSLCGNEDFRMHNFLTCPGTETERLNLPLRIMELWNNYLTHEIQQPLVWTLTSPPPYPHTMIANFDPLNGVQGYIPNATVSWLRKKSWKPNVEIDNILLQTQIIIIETMAQIWEKTRKSRIPNLSR